MPPIFRGELFSKILPTTSGQIILFGVFVCMAGIAVAGMAGMSKEREMSEEQKKASIKEFDFKKGIIVATFSGVMSACFSYGLAAGDPIKEITLLHGTTTLWQGLPVLVVLLLGGFTTNFIWCMILHTRNKTGYQYFSSVSRPSPTREQETIIETTIDAPGEEVVEHASRFEKTTRRGLSHDSGITSSAPWRVRPGTSSSFSTPWARPRWEGSSSRAGLCTWPAS